MGRKTASSRVARQHSIAFSGTMVNTDTLALALALALAGISHNNGRKSILRELHRGWPDWSLEGVASVEMSVLIVQSTHRCKVIWNVQLHSQAFLQWS